MDYVGLQALARTRAIWYIGGQPSTVAQLHHQDTALASVEAVYIPADVWQQQFRARSMTALSGEHMSPSVLWTGNETY